MRKLFRVCEVCGEGKWVVSTVGISKRCSRCAQRSPEMKELRRQQGLRRRQKDISKQKIREAMTGRIGERNNHWQGGRYVEDGYVYIKLLPDDFFYVSAKQSGYIQEHRLIIAKSLGRNLHPWEIVHHRNHIRDDNRLENLQLVSGDKHRQITILEGRIEYLEITLQKQANLIKLLQWQLKEHGIYSDSGIEKVS